MKRRNHDATRAASLRRTWNRAVITLVALVALVGLMTVTTTSYQQARYAGTTVDLHIATEALLQLEQEIMDIAEPMFGVLYRFGPDGEDRYQRALAQYDVERVRVIESWDEAVAATEGGFGHDQLVRAREAWLEADAEVLGAADRFTTEDLMRFYVEDHDPYEDTVWARMEEAGEALTALRRSTVTEVADRVEAADRSQMFLIPSVIALVLLAFALALVTTRRVTRRVVAPLAAIGDRVRDLRDPHREFHLDAPDAVAEVQELVRVLNDTSSTLRGHHRALRDQALTDTLTLLPNRDGFTETLRAMLDDPRQHRTAILFIDLDDFKHINDTMGHSAGDAALRHIGGRLVTSIRSGDVAARLGGDEFAVAVDVSNDSAAASQVAERILASFDEPFHLAGRQVRLGCSIGIAVSDDVASASDADELLGNADFAMYLAKSQGKERYERYSPALHTEMLARMELANDLHRAISRDELVLHYQPLLDLSQRSVVGFEALVRWQHRDRGLIPPNDFIPLAEESGTIIDIGAWVLDAACAMMARHRPVTDGLAISVNVSPRQLEDGRFAATVEATLDRHGLAPGDLILEITEAIAMTNTKAAMDTIAVLRDHGVHVALDDFGTGYSSLRSLGDLPVDMIKIDRAFVQGTGPHHDSTLRSMVELATRLDLDIVAEGIEGEDDLERLQHLGHLFGQGYLFSRPVSEEEAIRYLGEHPAGRATEVHAGR